MSHDVAHFGFPLWLRLGTPSISYWVETKPGFKRIKCLQSIELVEDYRTIGEGHGGYREDVQDDGTGAEIRVGRVSPHRKSRPCASYCSVVMLRRQLQEHFCRHIGCGSKRKIANQQLL